jgi:hypothetical protein
MQVRQEMENRNSCTKASVDALSQAVVGDGKMLVRLPNDAARGYGAVCWRAGDGGGDGTNHCAYAHAHDHTLKAAAGNWDCGRDEVWVLPLVLRWQHPPSSALSASSVSFWSGTRRSMVSGQWPVVFSHPDSWPRHREARSDRYIHIQMAKVAFGSWVGDVQ